MGESQDGPGSVVGMLARVSDGIVALDRDWRYTYVNGAGAALLGREPGTLLGKHIWTEFPEGVGQPFHLAYEKAMAEQLPGSFEAYYAPWARWFENRLYPSPEGLLIFFHDVTARKLAERAERDLTELNRQIVASAQEGIAVFDRELRFVEVNPAMARMMDLSPEQVRGRQLGELIPATGLEESEARLRRAMAGEVISLVDQVSPRLATGAQRWVSRVVCPMRNSEGAIVGALAFVHDVSDRKRADQLVQCQSDVLERISTGASLPASLEALARGVEALAPGMLCSILLLDDEGTHLRHGAAPSLPRAYATAIDGAAIGPKAGTCGTAAYTGKPVYTPDIAVDPLWDDYRTLALPHGLRACWSTPLLAPDRRVRGTFALYYPEPGLPEPWHTQLISMATHVAEIALEHDRQRAELAASERRYHDLYEHAPDMYLSVDARTRTICECNATLTRVTGHERSELIGRPLVELYDPAVLDQVRQAYAEFLRTGELRDVELRVRCKDGHLIDVSLSSSAIRNADGTIVRSRSIWRDISRRKRAEEELLAVSARLMRSQDDERRRIARELHDATGQNLAALALNLALLRSRVDAGSPGQARSESLAPGVPELLEECVALTEQSAAELRTLTYLLHPPVLEDFGLEHAIREFVAGYTRRSGVQVTVEVEGPLTRPTRAVEFALFRVVQEGLSNVHRHSGSPTATVRLVSQADRLVLEVRDAGSGGWADAAGEGVGLAGMRERLRLLGGTLEIERTGGTCVRATAPNSGGNP